MAGVSALATVSNMKDGIKEILESRQFPGIAGVSDGPGSSSNEMVFNRPDMEKETRLTLRAMENAGQLDSPDKVEWAKAAMDYAKNTPQRKVDYEKPGEHPLD